MCLKNHLKRSEKIGLDIMIFFMVYYSKTLNKFTLYVYVIIGKFLLQYIIEFDECQ